MARDERLQHEHRAEAGASRLEVPLIVHEALPDIERLRLSLETIQASHTHHDGHAHDHGHTHVHEGKGVVKKASHKPEKMLTTGERLRYLGSGALWLIPAAIAFAIDIPFHIITMITPTPVDDVVVHGAGILFLMKAAGGLNAYWRGYEVPGANLNMSELWSKIVVAAKERKTNGGFLRNAARILSEVLPVETREPYRGEGYPTSSVTYAAENVLGSYSEGILGGWVKRIMSAVVVIGSIVTVPLGMSMRYVLSWLHELGEFTPENASWGRWLIDLVPKLAGAIVITPVYALAGALDGIIRYFDELGAGLEYGSQRKID